MDLVGNRKSLEGCNVYGNTDNDRQRFWRELKTNTFLLSLRLSSRFKFQELEHISDALKMNTTLNTLHFCNINIGPIIRVLAESLKSNAGLISLIIRFNQIDDFGAIFFAEALKFNNKLTVLNFSNNEITDEGMKYIANALKINNTLNTLEMASNVVGDQGAKYLADSLMHNTSLYNIGLNSNLIRHGGVKHLIKALKINTSLASLNIRFMFFLNA